MIGPPIALSIEDDGLDADVASWIEVLLDGALQSDVVAYDCRAGTVTLVSLAPAGLPLSRMHLTFEAGTIKAVPVEHVDEERRTVTLSGRVEARWREGTPPA